MRRSPRPGLERRFGQANKAGMMKTLAAVLVLLSSIAATRAENSDPKFDAATAERFARLALACVDKEYPNKISHVLNSDADVAPPRKLTPVFYGCYDWHSSVHGHWLLARLVKKFPEAPFAKSAREALRKSLTAENLKQEAAYLREKGRSNFERPYGLAWLLQLIAELREWDDPDAKEMLANLRPLEDAALERLTDWLPKLSHPVRIGEHAQTAFALGLLLDYARSTGNESFARLLSERARKFYLADKNYPLAYEPSGEDFLWSCGSGRDEAGLAGWGIWPLAKGVSAANPRYCHCGLVAGRRFARPERSQARSSRRIEPEPGLDVGRDYLGTSAKRSAPARSRRRRRNPSTCRLGSGDRRALRRRALARQFCRVSGNKSRRAEPWPEVSQMPSSTPARE